MFADRRATARTTTFVEPCSIQIKKRQKAAALAGVLTARHQTVTEHCFCIPKARIRDRHQCVIFKQMAMLRVAAFPHLDNTCLMEHRVKPVEHAAARASTIDKEASTLLTPLVQARKLTDYFQCRSDTYVDQLSDTSLAQILQHLIPTSDTANVEAPASITSQDQMEDPLDSICSTLLPLILGRNVQKYDDYSAQMLCNQLDTSQTRQLLQQNVDILLAETWVAELAFKCSMCDINTSEQQFPHITWNHLIQHVSVGYLCGNPRIHVDQML